MEELFNQMREIGRIATSMADFQMLYVKHPAFGFSESHYGRMMISAWNIHDTINALGYYLGRKTSNHDGERYVLICGVFQSLYLQQETVSHMREILLPEKGKIIWGKEYPAILKIRKYRNRYFGHPTEGHKDYSFHVGALQPFSNSLVSVSLAQARTFQESNSVMGTTKIDLHECIKEQQILFREIMIGIWNELNQKLNSK